MDCHPFRHLAADVRCVFVFTGTKYLNGHSDIVCGVVAGKRALVAQVKKTLDHLGGCLDTHACFLLNRGAFLLAIVCACVPAYANAFVHACA